MKAFRHLFWVLFGLLAGAGTHIAITKWGLGLVKSNALPMAAIAGIFAFGLRFVRLVPPSDDRARRRAVLTRTIRNRLRISFAVLLLVAVGYAVQEARQGYPALPPERVLMGDSPVPLGFYTLEGKPLPDATYQMRNQNRQIFLIPVDRYEGRVLVMLDEPPPQKVIRVTGRLRTDVRTVETDGEGRVQGPFHRVYRERMGLPESAQIYYLDTGKRAALNVGTVLLVLFPAYLFLLTQGAAVQRRTFKTRPRHR